MAPQIEALAEYFEWQASLCEQLGSPFTALLCRMLPSLLDPATGSGKSILQWQGSLRADAVALRLCGALHFLVLSGKDAALASLWPPERTRANRIRAELPGAISRNDSFITRFIQLPPQTNEVARSAMLLPGFLEISRRSPLPIDLVEIGSSAGLNLCFDAFCYDYSGRRWGPGEATILLETESRGGALNLQGEISICGREGCDISPVDLGDKKQRERLRAYVWADQRERLARLDSAMDIARRQGVVVQKSAAVEFLREKLVVRKPGSTLAIFHSVMWQYMSSRDQRSVESMLAEAGAGATADAPLAWLRMESADHSGRQAVLSLSYWPGGDTQELAHCDFHGRWIRML